MPDSGVDAAAAALRQCLAPAVRVFLEEHKAPRGGSKRAQPALVGCGAQVDGPGPAVGRAVAQKHRQQGHKQGFVRRDSTHVIQQAADLRHQRPAARVRACLRRLRRRPLGGPHKVLAGHAASGPQQLEAAAPHNHVLQLVLVRTVDGKRRLADTAHQGGPAGAVHVEAKQAQQRGRGQAVLVQLFGAQHGLVEHELAHREPHGRILVAGVVVRGVLAAHELASQLRLQQHSVPVWHCHGVGASKTVCPPGVRQRCKRGREDVKEEKKNMMRP